MRIKPQLVFIFIIALCLGGCFTAPEFKGVDKFKFEKFKNNELSFHLLIDLHNPNPYGIRVRRSKMDVFVNDDFIGEAKLTKSFKMKRKSTTNCLLPVTLSLEKGKAFKLLALANVRRGVNIRLKGVLKASALLIPKRERIDQEQNVNLKDLNIDFKKLLSW